MRTPCKIWDGNLDGKGRYGVDRIEGRQTTAHRVAYCRHYRVSLAEIRGLDVCHSCDTPRCVNVDHLWLGSRKNNMEDAVAKGRTSKGERHAEALALRDFRYDAEHARRTQEGAPKGEDAGQAKLTASQVQDCRRLWATGIYTQGQLAEMFGIHQSSMCEIVNRKSYRNVA